jgi:hypothetical protein
MSFSFKCGDAMRVKLTSVAVVLGLLGLEACGSSPRATPVTANTHLSTVVPLASSAPVPPPSKVAVVLSEMQSQMKVGLGGGGIGLCDGVISRWDGKAAVFVVGALAVGTPVGICAVGFVASDPIEVSVVGPNGYLNKVRVTMKNSEQSAPVRLDGLVFGSQPSEITLTPFKGRPNAGGKAYESGEAVASSAMSPKVSFGTYQVRAVQGTSVAESTVTLRAGSSSYPYVFRDPDGSSVVSVAGDPNEVVHVGVYEMPPRAGPTVDARLLVPLPKIALDALGVGSYRIPSGSVTSLSKDLVILTSNTEYCLGHNDFRP